MQKPYKFIPRLKQTVWGGGKIASYKGIENAPDFVGESWEIASMPSCDSVVCQGGDLDGSDVGLTLSRLIEKHKDALMGQEAYKQFGNRFPLLIKFLDSNQASSIQVHPNDFLAHKRHNCWGKDEMWYVIDAEEKAEILSGLSQSLTPDRFMEIIRQAPRPDSTHPFMDYVKSHPSHPEDVFFLPSGCIHALGAGNLVAEIQKTSDVTYRVFDFCRKDKDGRQRELHIEQAQDAIDYNITNTESISYDHKASVAKLVDSNAFQSYRLNVDGPMTTDLHCDSFVVAICLQGKGMLNETPIRQGETFLLSASDNVLRLDGKVVLLVAHI
ncbi:MAG: class I mannose-6-phosphate isomerase [Bacteroidaceae bacterium]|nr:class I mannose-6-phosphate isomerase [Bacteroidaceae bacterium]